MGTLKIEDGTLNIFILSVCGCESALECETSGRGYYLMKKGSTIRCKSPVATSTTLCN